MNRVQLTGRLTRDPELRELPSGEKVCEMRIAVDGGGRNHEAGYFNVVSYGDSGRAAGEFLKKGWLVAVDGRLEHRQWKTEADENREATSIVGHVEFLAAPKGESTGSGEGDTAPATEGGGDDIPF